MKKIRKQLITLIFTLAFILIFSGTVYAAEWTVGPDGTYNFTAIKDAIAGSSDTDTITVYPNGTGVYNENVVVNKNLTIKANSSNTVVNGTFVVTAAGSGSTIQGFTVNYVSEEEGFYLFRPSEVTIKNNTINGFINGITLAYSDDNTVTGNTITNCVNGIYTVGSNSNTISGNDLSDNSNVGIYINLYSNDNNIINNIANNNGYGIYTHLSRNNLIQGNTLNGNTLDGLTLEGEQTDSNTVTGNTITGNHRYGIISNSGGNSIHYNCISGNSVYQMFNRRYAENAQYNWWGSNDNPFTSGKFGGEEPDLINYSPWLFMTINANPNPMNNGETSLITVSFNNYSSDGTTYTPFDPATGHIPDGTPVIFNAERSIDGSSTTSGGIATATLTADGAPGEADISAVTDAQTVNTSVTINPKSSLYLTVTPSKTNPVAGDTVIYTLKVGNNGPDTAENVVMTYVIPEGLEFVGATDDTGNTWTYDENTRTITWNMGSVPKGDPNLWLNLRVAQAGQYLINPTLTTSTYDPTLNSNIQSFTVNAIAEITQVPVVQVPVVNSESKITKTTTIRMHETGIPLPLMLLAILMVLGGFLAPKRK